MFGIGTFGEVTFAEALSPSGIYNLSVAETVTAVDAVTSLAVFAGGVLETLSASDAPSPLVIFQSSVTEAGPASDSTSNLADYLCAHSDALTAVDAQSWSTEILGEFNLSGEATLAFVGTTAFIDMIEQGEVEMGISAEIRTRSL